MKRKIKFRGFVLETEDSVLRPNIWVYGDLLHNQRGLPSETIYKYSIWSGLLYYVDPESVGEFTGLQDSEGVDIYEGDVLQVDESYINYVIFDKGLFQLKDSIWTLHGVINYNDKIKIIGNIYQNPELL